MASSAATTVAEYLRSLPPDRRRALTTVRKVIRGNLPAGYVEAMNWGMISYEIPLDRYPNTYNRKPLGLAGLASQKNYMSLYLMSVYGDAESRFRDEYRATGKKLDMGKSCIRFRSVDGLPLDLIGRTIAAVPVDEYIARYESSRGGGRSS